MKMMLKENFLTLSEQNMFTGYCTVRDWCDVYSRKTQEYNSSKIPEFMLKICGSRRIDVDFLQPGNYIKSNVNDGETINILSFICPINIIIDGTTELRLKPGSCLTLPENTEYEIKPKKSDNIYGERVLRGPTMLVTYNV